MAVHPYHRSGIGAAVFDAPFDAVESESGSIFSSRLAAMNSGLCPDPRLSGAAMLGSSDAHYVSAIGNCYSLIQAAEPTVEAVREAIVHRGTRPGRLPLP